MGMEQNDSVPWYAIVAGVVFWGWIFIATIRKINRDGVKKYLNDLNNNSGNGGI